VAKIRHRDRGGQSYRKRLSWLKLETEIELANGLTEGDSEVPSIANLNYIFVVYNGEPDSTATGGFKDVLDTGLFVIKLYFTIIGD